MLEVMRTFANLGAGSIERVEIWLYDEATRATWRDVLEGM